MKRLTTVVCSSVLLLGASCEEEVDREAEPGRLSPEVADPASPPDASMFLPPLPGFRVDDDIDAGEIQASLDHGGIPYIEVRRRMLLDDDDFARGEIMVLTFPRGSDGGQRFLRHWFGDADRETVDIAGVEMLRIAADPHDAIVWVGPDFVVVFSRGQAMSHTELEEVTRTTVWHSDSAPVHGRDETR